MKKIQLTILLLGILTAACRDYDLIIGKSVYEPHRSPTMSSWGKNVPYYLKEGEKLSYQGTYATDPYKKTGLIRQFDLRKGWSYVILMETMPVEEGTLVAVSGRVVTVERLVTGTGRISRWNQLEVEDYEVLCDTGPVREQARREYARIRGRLQEQVSLPGSKLILTEDPQWRVDWLKGEDAIVVVAHCSDLMYAAEAQFRFSQGEQKLTVVYFQEWFKGE